MAGNLLLFARDPGNANQIVALAELLQSKLAGLCVKHPSGDGAKLVAELTHGRNVNQLLFAAHGVAARLLEAAKIKTTISMTDHVLRDPTSMLREKKITTVVTGLSDWDDNTPQELWKAAANNHVKSFAITDDTTISLKHARKDLNQRFRDSNGIEVFPDILCVVDKKSHQAAINAGMSDDSILTVGNLHLQRFQRLARKVGRDNIITLRQKWGAAQEKKVILYASEPITQMRKYGKTRNYDELSLLSVLMDQVRNNNFAEHILCNTNTIIVIRPHPRDHLAKFQPYLINPIPQTIVSCAGSSAEAVLAADAIVGISSMLLVEAATLNRPSFSLIDFDPYAAARST